MKQVDLLTGNRWVYPASNTDRVNLPATGQQVLAYYVNDDRYLIGPVLMTPVPTGGFRKDDAGNDISVYARIWAWHELPDPEEVLSDWGRANG